MFVIVCLCVCVRQADNEEMWVRQFTQQTSCLSIKELIQTWTVFCGTLWLSDVCDNEALMLINAVQCWDYVSGARTRQLLLHWFEIMWVMCSRTKLGLRIDWGLCVDWGLHVGWDFCCWVTSCVAVFLSLWACLCVCVCVSVVWEEATIWQQSVEVQRWIKKLTLTLFCH